MDAWLLAHEPLVRGATFLSLLISVAAAETVSPRRPWRVPRGYRWRHNLALVVLDTLVLRLLFPVLSVEFALQVNREGWGVLNMLSLPLWLTIPLALVALDLAIYLQHRAFHALPLLWRLHAVHHADPDLDVTTGVRFHPVEIVLSLLIKMAVIATLGAPPVAVLLFELLLNATSMFNHGNITLSPAADRAIRTVLVTPDMHRIHHSVRPGETNSNFGFNHPWWDHLFATYRDQPQDGHDAMTIGLGGIGAEPRHSLLWMLLFPLRPQKRLGGALS
jgi:sterol desaturase/sphingolipid hydroxylase (fatty acid hydroxylase superfamily)